ncbi:spore gernimation protein XA, partial [Bacillus toyonensis]|nr:spore gernimation protein XA [Bacillus toyonensis]
LVGFMVLIVGLFIFLNPNVDQYLFIYSLMDILNIIFFILLPILFFAYSILFAWVTRRKQL